LLLLFLASCNTATLKGRPDAAMDDPDTGDDAGLGLPFPSTSNAHVIVEPGDNGNAIVDAIAKAKTSVHMTMYLLSNNAIMNALIARKKAGVEVKVVLNKTFPDPGFDNTPEFDQLAQAGVAVTWAPAAFTYTHAKCVVIDGTVVWIMTMNLTFSSPTSNREYLVVDEDPSDVAEAEAIFQADFAGSAATASRLLVAPINARARLLALIGFAKQTLDVEAESMSDAGIVSALVAAKNAGVAVRVVFSDQNPSQAMQQSIGFLKGAGIPVVKLSTPYQHAKVIVADGIAAYVGSENFTQNSLDSNREIGLVLTTDVALITSTIDADFKAGTAL
jgi:phosphatidylserine/phosphatidylglycerophosphate/cardiolipin synthase-like enzyme